MNAQSKITLISGKTMPIMGLGTWELTNDTTDKVAEALKLGFRMVDTSGDYGTQPGVGEGIDKSGLSRKDIFLTTKVEEMDNSYEATRHNLDDLHMTYADLILIHRPPEEGSGKNLWEGLIRAKEDGFAKEIGVSNYSTDQIQELINFSGEVPAVNQIEWTPFGHDMDMLSYCQMNDIIVQAYSPLTRGHRLDNDILQEIAEDYGKTPSQILLRWNIQLGVVPIVKASNIEHIKEDLDIFDFELTEDDMDELTSLNEAYSTLGSLSYFNH